MSQVTNGVRSILSMHWAYSLFQNIMGAKAGRKNFVDNFVRPFDGANLLDIGCGPAEIIDFLPDVNYFGFDISKNYIDRAISKWGARGNFFCKALSEQDLENLPRFDLVTAIGVLHHLDDATASYVINLAYQALKPGGRLVTIDPCFTSNQNPVARFLIASDRGQSVRSQSGYTSLVEPYFTACQVEVQHKRWIPYTHCYMSCTKNDSI